MLVTREDPALYRRITAEFHEMPGLTLTLPQAARLFNLEIDRCERVLEELVDDGQLTATRGSFALRRGDRESMTRAARARAR